MIIICGATIAEVERDLEMAKRAIATGAKVGIGGATIEDVEKAMSMLKGECDVVDPISNPNYIDPAPIDECEDTCPDWEGECCDDCNYGCEEEEEEVVELTMEERIIGIEKKQNIILVFVLVTALLSLFTFISGLGGNKTYKDEETEPTNTETQQATAYDTSAFTKVKAQDLEKLSKKDTIIVWIGRQGCGYCGQFAPIITSVGEKLDETIYYLDLADIFDFSTNPVTILDEEAYDLLLNFKTDGATENKEVMKEFGATPMTLVIKKNKIVGNFVGAYDEATALEILEDEGFKQK